MRSPCCPSRTVLAGFGHAVALDGDRLVVGAPGNWLGSPDGAAYVFEWNGSSWAKTATITPPAGSEPWFGGTVAMQGAGSSSATAIPGSWGAAPSYAASSSTTALPTPLLQRLSTPTLPSTGGRDVQAALGRARARRDLLVVGSPYYGAYVFRRGTRDGRGRRCCARSTGTKGRQRRNGRRDRGCRRPLDPGHRSFGCRRPLRA